jgi:hypothetical protein
MISNTPFNSYINLSQLRKHFALTIQMQSFFTAMSEAELVELKNFQNLAHETSSKNFKIPQILLQTSHFSKGTP